MLKPITSSELIEIQIKDLVNKVYMFPEVLNLRNRFIKYIFSANTSNSVGVGFEKSPLNRNAVGISTYTQTFSAINNSLLTLTNKKNMQGINKIPLSRILLKNAAGDNNELIEINDVIDWPKTLISLTDLTGIVTTESFIINVLYNEHKVVKLKDFNNLKHEIIEIPIVQNSGLKWYFPDNEKLRNKKIVKIEVITGTSVNTPLGHLAKSDSFFLTLNVSGKERISSLPSWALTPSNFGLNEIVFDEIIVDFTKSYITLPVTESNANIAAYMQIYYKD
jgi:hypothetical protein